MFYKSTRNSNLNVSGAQAVLKGISDDGGLFVPSEIPAISLDDISGLAKLDYCDRAKFIISKYFTDYTEEEIEFCTKNAYSTKNFDTDNIHELTQLGDNMYLLELWHGPTCAFKDMALQILPYFLTTAAKKCNFDKELVILVATSGDTGKAALTGFCDVDGTKILVFYPEDGVSAMQKKQMTTQDGKNVGVCAIKGNFDDCQNGVKKIFTDDSIKAHIDSNNAAFSSANSINFGRLLPQIVYYISSYATLVDTQQINLGDKINIVVPTGNFGNILAAYYAKNMGLPVNKLICASNANNVLTDFINTGVYDRNREFFTTISPSMDILISSNLERLLYMLCDDNDEIIKDWFSKLSSCGKYEISDDVKAKLQNDFVAGYCDDNATKSTIADIFNEFSYVADTHTSVAIKVYQDYVKNTGDTTKTVIASTASPYKFCSSVLDALSVDTAAMSDWDMLEKLSEISSTEIPAPLAELKSKEVRFTDSIGRDDMSDYVKSFI
ncbi:MAG: threonine synthase [Oscillospiraceae bacterium]|nr:threonine synthase [Oscillospiraceae bacterium]